MQIDHLIQILEAMETTTKATTPCQKDGAKHPYVGMYVIARCYAAGVHAGVVRSVDGENVTMEQSRRLWSWKAKEGIALSGVARHGIKEGCKVDVEVPVYLTGVCELIPCSQAAEESIRHA